MALPDAEAEAKYRACFLEALPKHDAQAILDTAQSSTVSSPRAHRYTRYQQEIVELADIKSRVHGQDEEAAIVLVENIDLDWIIAIGSTWAIDVAFFVEHARNPPGSSPWQAVFGQLPSQQRRPEQNGSLEGRPPSKHPRNAWHVDGVYTGIGNAITHTGHERLSQVNTVPRRQYQTPLHGWNISTRFSYCLPNPKLYLILVDAPPSHSSHVSPPNLATISKLHLPLSHNRGGLVLPQLLDHPHFSLYECMLRFLSHRWHIDVLFGGPKAHCPLRPDTIFYMLSTSTWATNLRLLSSNIEHIAFDEIRRPTLDINDRLHDYRRDLAILRAEVIKIKKWMPGSVDTEMTLVKVRLDREQLSFPHDRCVEVLTDTEAMDKVLMDTFQLLISSVAVRDSQISLDQASRSQKLTQLAAIYLPLSFVTGVFGMNVKEINGSAVSAWIPVVALLVTGIFTTVAFELYKKWEDRASRRPQKHKSV